MVRRYRSGFISPKIRQRARNIASRSSDFYNRTAPMLKRTAPIWKPIVAKAIKSRPKMDRAVRVLMNMRNRFKRRAPGASPAPKTAMEYVSTPSEGNSTSYFTRKALRLRGFKKRILRNSPLQLRTTEFVNSMTWAYGTQTFLSFLNNTTAELSAITGLIPGANNTTQMMLQSTKIHYMLSSGSKAGIKLRIYEGCYKKDLAVAYDPGTLWTNGLLDTGSTMTPLAIDAKPFASIGFMKQLHISKVTNLFLPQGRTHEHYVTYNYNKIFNREETNLTNNAYLKGWTRFTMFVAYGEPVADEDADVTTAGGRLLVIASKTHRYRYNNPTNYTGNYVRSIPITGITSQRLLDEGSGEIEVNTVL